MARKPAQWAVTSAELSPEGAAIHDKIVVGYPMWETSGTTTEEIKGGTSMSLGGAVWSTNPTYGAVIARNSTADANGAIANLNPPDSGSLVVLIHRRNSGITEIPWLDTAQQHFGMKFAGTDVVVHNCGKSGGTNATGADAGNTMLLEFTYDTGAGTGATYIDGTLATSITGHTSVPATANHAIGKVSTFGFDGFYVMAFITNAVLTADERSDLVADEFIWVRRVRELSADFDTDITATAGLNVTTSLGAGMSTDVTMAAGVGAGRGMAGVFDADATMAAGVGIDTVFGAAFATDVLLDGGFDVVTALVTLGANFSTDALVAAGLGIETALGASLAADATVAAGVNVTTALGAGFSTDPVVAAGLAVETALGASLGADALMDAGLVRELGFGADLSADALVSAGVGITASFGATLDTAVTLDAGLLRTRNIGAGFSTDVLLEAGLTEPTTDVELGASFAVVATWDASLYAARSYEIVGGGYGRFYFNSEPKLIRSQ